MIGFIIFCIIFLAIVFAIANEYEKMDKAESEAQAVWKEIERIQEKREQDRKDSIERSLRILADVAQERRQDVPQDA